MLRLITLLCLGSLAAGQQRHAPGVPPPGQYQQQRQPNQQHYQGGAPGVPPQQYQGAPGVPPQQYQGAPGVPPPQQQAPQYQHQPPSPPPQQQQYQQQPQQQQAAKPGFQQHQQQPAAGAGFQQQQQQQQHVGGGFQQHPGQHNQRVLHNPNLSDERDHIKDHLEVPIDTAGMSDQELQFHYFKMHDADNNNKLDGQELIKSLFHWHDSSNHDPSKAGHHPPPEPKLFTDDELVNMIDPILDQDDKDRDGYIDYPEFVQAQRNAAAAASTAGK